jgi:hypothetical protein
LLRHSPSKIRGRRECRAPGAPAAACAVVESTRVSHHGHTGNTRHSPRNGFNGFLRTLPGDRACLPPSSPRSLLLKNLTPASGCQDHTTSPSASAPLVLRRHRVHRIPHPTFVTTRTPLLWDGMAESIKLRLANREAKYFSLKGWTQRQDTKSQTSPSGKSVGPAVVDLQVRALGDVRESGTSRALALGGVDTYRIHKMMAARVTTAR